MKIIPYGIELGCGKGAFITELAKRNPDKNYLAAESNKNVAVTAAERVMASINTDEPINNIRLFVGGAERLGDYVKPGSISRIYINHPDPWPRRNHEKRRLSYQSYVHMYWNLLCDDGKVIFKTDNRPLFDYSISSFKDNGFDLTDVTYDLVNSKYYDSDIISEYQAYFISKGLPIHRFTAVKLPEFVFRDDIDRDFVTIPKIKERNPDK
ncbi:MAG: tRNA (guanosine(46)-N7)-methyltransferase TrmB [Clostridiales bacterium]|nr:tRNA (guanosine(46)-N7)-methyltransferase TrmB [Clostridiales bacterium]